MKSLGAVACGHPETAKAAELILKEGGNAFDAILAAHFMACVVEPVLASLAGGGFLLARTGEGRERLYDFFAHTPQVARPSDELDFYPILADFGTTSQEFHIGLASVAVPGAVKGIFKIHEHLCSMPMSVLAQPAIDAARQGVSVNSFQAYILEIVSPIFCATSESRRQYQSMRNPDGLIGEGEPLQQTQLADFLEALVQQGADWFYQGDIAHSICDLSARQGGQITLQDLKDYEVILREPVRIQYKQHQVLTNAPPSCGGPLIAFALNLAEAINIAQFPFGSSKHLQSLAEIMALTNEARLQVSLSSPNAPSLQRLFDPDLLQQYREKVVANIQSLRGTTHMSVIDSMGNVAGMTVSNGEGCGHMIPDTGVMLNNMLGEQDLNPHGFCRWPANQRMTSMMAPTVVISPQGKTTCLGSGGSNRLRTAILQVLVNLIDFHQPLDDAVNNPRIHYENGLLSMESGFDTGQLQGLSSEFANPKIWTQKNLFFGGVHTVTEHQGVYEGAGDQRRGGVARIVI